MTGLALDDRLAALSDEERERLDALLRYPSSFVAFVNRANPRFTWYRPHIELAKALQAVADGTIRRLMVFFPPQEGKSEETTRLFPAYYLTMHPDRWVGLGAYAFDLAKGFSRAARSYYGEVMTQVIGSDGIAEDASAVDEWRTPRNGGLWAVGRGGAATGKSAHLLVVDDPIKDRAEADSETIRQNVNDWYKSVLNMRLQPDPDNAVVVIHTRWHEDDLAGHLLALERQGEWTEGWTVLDLPGIAEERHLRPQYPETVNVWPDWRQPGEPLGGRYTIRRYQQVHAISGTREYEAQVQQRPAPAQGTIFKRQWWKRYGAPGQPELPKRFDRVIFSVDAAFKDTDGSDYVAIHIYGRVAATVWLVDRLHAHLSFTETVDSLKIMSTDWKRATLYIEDKANGTAVVNTLQQTLLGVVPVEPEGGKVARAYACQGDVEHGRVYIPDDAVMPSIAEFVSECASFPAAPHDDDVDAFTQAMTVFRGELRDAIQRGPTLKVASEIYAEPIDPKTGKLIAVKPISEQLRDYEARKAFSARVKAPRRQLATKWEGER